MLQEPRRVEVLEKGPPDRSCRYRETAIARTVQSGERAEQKHSDLALPTLPPASCQCLSLLTPTGRQTEGCMGVLGRQCVASTSQGSKQDSKGQTRMWWGSRWSITSTFSKTKNQMRECVQNILQTKS